MEYKKKILILGGGVAGATLAYCLKKKKYEVFIIEKTDGMGGLSRTYKYAGHPYEFGPHIWFWNDEEVNNIIKDLTDNELFFIERKLFSFVKNDNKKYRYPIHFSSIEEMTEKNQIYRELKKNRNKDWKLKNENMPKLGECTFEEYFKSAIGNTLYKKFMENYTWKMWNIPGNELQTSMMWADILNHKTKKLSGYDPLKFEDFTLGKGIKFQVYPKKGWSSVWNKMTEKANIIHDEIIKIDDSDKNNPVIKTKSGKNYHFKDYYCVINTLDVDQLWGEDILPYTGRMIIPLLIPELERAFPEGAESIHFPGEEFQTRTTEMKTITRHKSDDTLILIEIPINSTIREDAFPENVINYAKKNCLFCKRAYPQQSKDAIKLYKTFIDKGKHIKNLIHCGRHAEFKYWGMAETVSSAYYLVKDKF